MADAHKMAAATDEQFEEALAAARADKNLSRENVVANVLTIAKPVTVTGLDGKSYIAHQPSRKRRSLPAAFHDATYDLAKAATRLENLHKDDRFQSNRQAVRRHRADLFRAQTILRKLIADLGDDQGVLI
jgi:hypothetical protein